MISQWEGWNYGTPATLRFIPDKSPHNATFQLWYWTPNTIRTDKPTKAPMMANVTRNFIKQEEGGLGTLILTFTFRNKCQNRWNSEPDLVLYSHSLVLDGKMHSCRTFDNWQETTKRYSSHEQTTKDRRFLSILENTLIRDVHKKLSSFIVNNRVCSSPRTFWNDLKTKQ